MKSHIFLNSSENEDVRPSREVLVHDEAECVRQFFYLLRHSL